MSHVLVLPVSESRCESRGERHLHHEIVVGKIILKTVLVVLSLLFFLHSGQLANPLIPQEQSHDVLAIVPALAVLVCEDLPLLGPWHDLLVTNMPLNDQLLV